MAVYIIKSALRPKTEADAESNIRPATRPYTPALNEPLVREYKIVKFKTRFGNTPNILIWRPAAV